MAKYLFQGSYSAQGAGGVLKEGGSARRTAVTNLIESLGGTVECLYFALGGDDYVVIADVDEVEKVIAASLMVGSTGAVSMRTTMLITPEQVDAAAKISASYTPPGGS